MARSLYVALAGFTTWIRLVFENSGDMRPIAPTRAWTIIDLFLFEGRREDICQVVSLRWRAGKHDITFASCWEATYTTSCLLSMWWWSRPNCTYLEFSWDVADQWYQVRCRFYIPVVILYSFILTVILYIVFDCHTFEMYKIHTALVS